MRHLLSLAALVLLLVGCDRAEDEPRLAIPATPEGNRASFRFGGANFDPGEGFGEDVFARGTHASYEEASGRYRHRTTILVSDRVAHDSLYAVHSVLFDLFYSTLEPGALEPGTYDLTAPGFRGVSYAYFLCPEPTTPVPDCERGGEYRLLRGSLDVQASGETGLAATSDLLRFAIFDENGEQTGLLRVEDFRVEVRFLEE